jgi:hypothetical protein
VTEKSIGHNLEEQVIPLLPELSYQDRSDGRLCGAVGGLKGTEIVGTDQTSCSRSHGICLQSVRNK